MKVWTDTAYYTRFQFTATLNKLSLNKLVEVLYQGMPVYSNVNTMEEIHIQYMWHMNAFAATKIIQLKKKKYFNLYTEL